MLKPMLSIVALSMMVALTGCNNNDAAKKTAGTTPASTPAKTASATPVTTVSSSTSSTSTTTVTTKTTSATATTKADPNSDIPEKQKY